MPVRFPRSSCSSSRRVRLRQRALCCGPSLLLACAPAYGVVVYGTGTNGDGRNTAAPTGTYANSGYQYEGEFSLNAGNTFVGTPISPYSFLTAAHISAYAGLTFTSADGTTHTLEKSYSDPNSDLQLWEVNTPFTTWAPLYTAGEGTETGKTFVVYGAGRAKGSEIITNGTANGWYDGTLDGKVSWGIGQVAGVVELPVGSQTSEHIGWLFKSSLGSNSATITDHDSGGGLFIQVNGTWELAGINHAVAPDYSLSANGANSFDGAIFNPTGLYDDAGANGAWEASGNVSNSFATEIDQSLNFVESNGHVPTNWSLKSSGSWLTSANWSAAVPGLPGDTATFGTNGTGGTITLDGNHTLTSLVFNGNNSYTIAQGTGGGTLTISSSYYGTSSGSITVNQGSHAITAPLSLSNGATVNFSNYSGLTVGTVAGTGPLAITGAGTMTVGAGGSLPANLALSIGAFARLKLTDNTSPSLTTLSSLTLTGSSTLDLGNNNLMLNYSGASPLTNIANLVSSAQSDNLGGLSGNRTWNGTGITSTYSQSVNTANGKTALLGIGYQEASFVASKGYTSWMGQSISTTSTAVLVMPTLIGDITMQGVVNADDLGIFAANYGQDTSLGWAVGDFFNEGAVNADSLGAFAANYGYSLSGIVAVTPAEYAQGEALLGSLGSGSLRSVPEPATAMLLGIGAGALLTRRRRARRK